MKSVLVRLREAGQLMTYQVSEDVSMGDYVIVEADRGFDYGEIIETNEIDFLQNGDQSSLKSIIRKATVDDRKQIKENKQEAKGAMKTCSQKIREYKLPMKLVDIEYSFDKKKIVIYFTAEERIDFRELVKDLAKIFKIRVEMRQIGVRDETRIFGGIGPCGQVLCCVRFLKGFEPVTMKMAKLQKLPLSAGKISGICGRLMCCLSYEHKAYREYSKGLPKEGQNIDTPSGKGKVASVNILKRIVYVKLEDGRIEKVFFEKR
ncbi:MAG: stage 0 sporulation protein [Candidatus Omnitrophica bacterium]|nr:stage 0 sporulation protein [Candidatus Omnitrophota bacterium]MBU1524628.1 stage 0 sporulation protein [Candidatus Omnitrophota bacterium]MBU2436652.1 stage 0 sporulation protein [Candidatus Omnitrophota bacterium]MBU2504871.1 stage 0 sporulation protein [Candidatus Omnitrophota bacterium]